MTDFKSVVSTSFTIPANIKAAIYTCRAASPRFVAYIIEKLTTGTSLAEEMRFELMRAIKLLSVFKTDAFNRLATLPCGGPAGD